MHIPGCLVVYPWTQKWFGNFGNLFNVTVITANLMIATQKFKLHGLDGAVQNMNYNREVYAVLSMPHSEKLHVDPDNFKVNQLN